jgi:NADH-quinone oxidoreductase subunit N
MLVLLLSLGGIPPLSGFWAKLFLFWAAAEQGLYSLVVIGVLASVMSLYYYLMVARAMYILPPGRPAPIAMQRSAALAVLLCVLVVLLLAYPRPLLDLTHGAAVGLFEQLPWFVELGIGLR